MGRRKNNEAVVSAGEQQGEIDVAELMQRMDQLTQVITAQNEAIHMLMGAVFTDEKPPPKKRKTIIRADAAAAKNARVGRGAARRGWSYKQWLETFGRKEYPELSARDKKKADAGPR